MCRTDGSLTRVATFNGLKSVCYNINRGYASLNLRIDTTDTFYERLQIPGTTIFLPTMTHTQYMPV